MLKRLKGENFSEKTKIQIIKNASICQMCFTPTNCGECAHIVASGKNGPRNRQELTQDGTISDNYDIKSVDNGIYLCANCHKKIDKYPEKYTFEYLKRLTSSLIEHEDIINDTELIVNHNHIQKDLRSKRKVKLIIKNPANQLDVKRGLIGKVSRLKIDMTQLVEENNSLKENQPNIVIPPAFLKQDNNVHIIHKSDLLVQISDGEKYITVPIKQVITDLIENKKNLLREYLEKYGDKYEGTHVLDQYNKYLSLLENDKKTRRDLEHEIINMLLNTSSLIGSDELS